jgi:outer membrane receptor protein involved in Fe transport
MWNPKFGPSNPASTPYGGLCYPGAPYYAQPTITYAPGTAAALTNQEQRWVGLFHPSSVFVNLAVSYKFGDEPESIFLKNLRIAFNVQDLFNRLPSSLTYDPRTTSGAARIRQGADFQRVVSLTLTKAW